MIDRHLLSNISYHPHMATILHMEGDACRWSGVDSTPDHQCDFFGKPDLIVAQACQERREHLERAATKYFLENTDFLIPGIADSLRHDVICDIWSKACKNDQWTAESSRAVLAQLMAHIPTGLSRPFAKEFLRSTRTPRHLYRPMCSVTLGNTDNLSIVLSDEFSYASELLKDPQLPVRQSCVALCPDVTNKALDDSLDQAGIIFNLQELFERWSKPEHADPDQVYVPTYGFTHGRPLIAVTYYRTTGLCNFGSGLLFQEAIIREMRRRIIQTARDIKPDGDVITERGLASFRCAFLVPIGWADLCTVMLASDYSIMLAMLSQIRRMRFRHLYDTMRGTYGESNILERMVREFDLHARIAKWENTNRGDGSPEASRLLAQNHVFSSTATTLGIEHHAFASDGKRTRAYGGLVSADPHVNIAPGHDQCLKAREELTKDPEPAKLYSRPARTDVIWVATGLYDCTDQSLFCPGNLRELELPDLFARIKKLRGLGHNPKDHQTWSSQDLFTELFVPIPRVLPFQRYESKLPASHVNLRPLLAELRVAVFQKDASPLSLSSLKQSLESMRIPLPIRTAVMQCYADFAIALGDPMLFDNVLDVYDIFAAVHRLFTQEMQESLDTRLSGKQHLESRRLAFLDEGKMQEITAIVELIEDALKRRTDVGFRQARRSQEAIDSRGGFNRFISAIDVPIKCGLGLLRRVLAEGVDDIVPKSDIPEKDDLGFRSRVGGASRMSYCARATKQRFRLGDPSINFVAEINFNTEHLTRPTFVYTHIHEAGHLLCDFIRGRVEVKSSPSPTYCNERCWGEHCARIYEPPVPGDSILSVKERLRKHQRFEEIFAEMFAFGMIFGDDPAACAQTYLRQCLGMYYLDPVSTHARSEIAMERFTEILVRAFMATDPFIFLSRNGEDLYDPEINRDMGVDALVAEATKRFERFVERGSAVFLDNNRFWQNKRGKERKYVLDAFRSIYRESFPVLCCIWRQVRGVVQAVCSEVDAKRGIGTSPPKSDWDQIRQEFATGYDMGKPVIRFLYENVLAGGKKREKLNHLDTMYMMRQMLRVHSDGIFSEDELDISRECCNQPDLISRRGTNMRMLDRQRNGIVCMDFQERGRYLQQRLHILMTFWDLSSAMRGRSLGRLLDTLILTS